MINDPQAVQVGDILQKAPKAWRDGSIENKENVQNNLPPIVDPNVVVNHRYQVDNPHMVVPRPRSTSMERVVYPDWWCGSECFDEARHDIRVYEKEKKLSQINPAFDRYALKR